ncbi:MAG: hypothetical protein Q4Q58_05595 [Thermoplasmata archaeon]|nr:hypothetical protein [Thermoplasmata archaeon]
MAIAVALFAALSAFVIVATDESDASTAGTMNIYVYDGTGWSDYTDRSGYNALQGLQNTGLSITADTSYILQLENSWGTYTEINSSYGTVTAIGSVTNTTSSVWNVIIYDEIAEEWTIGSDALGFITPFEDGAIPSANIVLYYGADATTVPSAVTSYMSTKTLASLVSITNDTMYTYSFYIQASVTGYTPTVAEDTEVSYFTSDGSISTKVLTASDITSGITIVGYGSNAYAALKDALGDNVSGNDSAGAYNGWLYTLFDLGTVSSGSNYIYWAQYTGSGGYLNYNLGAYSALENVPSDGSATNQFNESSFRIIYTSY